MSGILIVICGPTCSGKTGLSIEIASALNTEIISADSRQVYREIPVGTAAPTREQLQKVTHHLVGHRSIHDYYSASLYESESNACMERLFTDRNILLMVGGSGLYIRAAIDGIDNLPDADQETRNELLARYQAEGIEGIRQMLKTLDPDYYRQVDLKNHRRILKALEVTLGTGKPYSSFLTRKKKERNYHVVKIGLLPERPILYNRINNRVEDMFAEGLVEEARKLHPYRHLNALNTVGYKELFQHFEGKTDLISARELIKKNTRNYARKQLTWFRKDHAIRWFSPESKKEILGFIIQQSGYESKSG